MKKSVRTSASMTLLVVAWCVNLPAFAQGQAQTQTNLQTPSTSSNLNQAAQSSKPNITIETAPIQIIAEPPDEEFKDEFDLPPGASPELVARRNLIDHTNAKINQVAEKIDQLMQSQTFDSSADEVRKLKALQEAYKRELDVLLSAQEAYRQQQVTDSDKK